MKEKREVISQIAEFLAYKIRSGAVSQEGGDKIWRVALEHPEKVDERGDIGCHRRDGPEGEKVSEKRYDPSGW